MQPTISNTTPINGIQIYYEIYGKGSPLIMLHGGGSTIQSSFERIIPLLAKTHHIIAIESQAHGRTADRNSPTSFTQDAEDVAQLMNYLDIKKADILGFSNGATTAIQLAINHPQKVNKLILGSPLAKRNGVPDWFWGFMANASLDNMPTLLKEAFLKVNPSEDALKNMHDKDAARMVNFKDISVHDLQSIVAPALIILAEQDVILTEHGIELNKLIPNSQLAILPGGHGAYFGEITTIGPDFKEEDLPVPLIERFLN
ncbi:alpha/beta fold hydrolase [Sphingobacterium mizutaii]|uniref:alpha/beta fold hydrolase n=1 Tax=Sphingobacterium mizutaii TaxID=1010 RepID=UPI0016291E15|nr:alpha/beta fold hydrolase [Sphingobacterium mizutaii]